MRTIPSAATLVDGSVRLGGRTIWHHVDITLDQGDFIAILGPNGAGKSTLLKVLLGVLSLTSGVATVLGRPPRKASADVGYLPQRRSFDAGLRIRGVDIVRLGLDGPRWGTPLPVIGALFGREQAIRKRVDEALDVVGAGAYARRPIGELSGGEQQRLLIAQALVGRPRMLFLDEPLDSLDLTNQQAVSALVQRICRDLGVTVLMVAHDVNPIISYLDRVLYVAGGSAVIGPPHEIVCSETLTRLYGTPIEVLRTSAGRLVVTGQPEASSFHPH